MAKFEPEEKKAIGDAVQALAVLFGRNFKPEELAIWVKNFEHEGLNITQVRQACLYFRASTELNYFPPFPQWVKAIRGSKNYKVEAAEKWDEIINLIERKGYYWLMENYNLANDGAVGLALRAVGGLDRLCNSSYEQLGFMRRTFIEAYENKAEALALPASNTSVLPEADISPEQAEENKRRIADLTKKISGKI